MKQISKEEQIQEEQPAWIKYIRQRIKDNKNFLGMFVGPTGSGKSLSAASVLQMLNKDFNVDMIVFSGKDLMRLINYGNYSKDKDTVIGFEWDEAGVSLGNRQWQSITNKVINFLLQTFRHKNFVLLFTAPYMDFIDSSTRKLFHATFETTGINKQKQTVTVKPKQIQYNADKKKFYYHYLRVVIPGVGSVKKKRWKIPRPSKELEKEYETKKIDFTSKLNKEIEGTLESLGSDGRVRRKLTDRQRDIEECWKLGIKNQTKIAEHINKKRNIIIYQPQISEDERSMRNKGYLKENY